MQPAAVITAIENVLPNHSDVPRVTTPLRCNSHTSYDGANSSTSTGTVAIPLLTTPQGAATSREPISPHHTDEEVSCVDKIKTRIVIVYGCSVFLISLASIVVIVAARILNEQMYYAFGGSLFYTSAGATFLSYQNYQLKNLEEELKKLKDENKKFAEENAVYVEQNTEHARLNALQLEQIKRLTGEVDRLKGEVNRLDIDVKNFGDEVLREGALEARLEVAVREEEEVLAEMKELNTAEHIVRLLQQKNFGLYQELFAQVSLQKVEVTSSKENKPRKRSEWCTPAIVEVFRKIKEAHASNHVTPTSTMPVHHDDHGPH